MLWFCRDLCSFGGEGVVILSWVYVHSSICETYLLLKWFSEIYAGLVEKVESVCHGYMCIHSICETSLLYCFSMDLCWIGGGGGVSLPLVYIHSSICQTYLL